LALLDAFRGALERLADDPRTRAVVITGMPGFFSAGVDLKTVPHYGPDRQAAMVRSVNALVLRLYGFPVPLVAAVGGHALGGGLVVAMCCDFRVGAEGSYRLGLSEARAGVPFPAAAMVAACAELTPAAARTLMLGGETVAPEVAVSLGVLDTLVPAEVLVDRAVVEASRRAAFPRDTYAHTKRTMRATALAEIARIVTEDADPKLRAWLDADVQRAAESALRRQD
jgi:enoyl-CoA hydratase